MKSLKYGGLQEMNFFRNRVGRAYGRGEIGGEQFAYLSNKVEALIKDLESLPEPIEEEEGDNDEIE